MLFYFEIEEAVMLRKIIIVLLFTTCFANVFSKSLQDSFLIIFEDYFKKNYPILLGPDVDTIAFYCGCNAVYKNGVRASVQFFDDANQVMQLLHPENRIQNFHEDDQLLCRMIQMQLESPEAQDRYIALFFLSECDVDDLSEYFLLKAIDDKDPRVQSQIMFLLTKAIASNRLVDNAFRLMIQHGLGQNIMLKMWSYEILRALVKNNYLIDVESMVNMIGINHELLIIQKMLLDKELYNSSLDIEKYMNLIQIIMQSPDEDVRYNGIYLLRFLKDYPETFAFTKRILLAAEFDTCRIWHQALWVLSKHELLLNMIRDEVIDIGFKAWQHENWLVRFAGVLFLNSTVYSYSYRFGSYLSEESESEEYNTFFENKKWFSEMVQQDKNKWVSLLSCML